MAYDPSVVVKTQLLIPTTGFPYLNRALFTFRPSTAGFLAGFIAGAEFTDPGTGDGLVAELTPSNWQIKLKAWGALEDEPVYQACSAHFNPLGAADAQGFREPVDIPPSVYIGRRTSAVVSQITVDYTTNTAGTSTFTVNRSINYFDDGWLAQEAIVADGVLTVTQLRDAAIAALNGNAAFAALYLAAPGVGPGEFTITSLVAGFPLLLDIVTTTGGPIITQTVTTTNVPGAYSTDLDEMQTAAELSNDPVSGKPERRWYWITDLQGDDTVNAEGYEWVQDQGEASPVRDYQFMGWSTDVLNFDPLSAGTSAAEIAAAANGGAGWNRAGVCMHDRYEFAVPALMGRTIGFLPGAISFTSKQLIGSTRYAKITPRSWGDNASLAAERTFNYNSPGGAQGSWVWGYLADGSYADRKWIEDYASAVVQSELIAWKIRRNIVSFTDADISAGAAVIKQALLTIPGLASSPTLITVTYKTRRQMDPGDIAARTYLDYTYSAAYGGVMNRIGTLTSPIVGTISESLA